MDEDDDGSDIEMVDPGNYYPGDSSGDGGDTYGPNDSPSDIGQVPGTEYSEGNFPTDIYTTNPETGAQQYTGADGKTYEFNEATGTWNEVKGTQNPSTVPTVGNENLNSQASTSGGSSGGKSGGGSGSTGGGGGTMANSAGMGNTATTYVGSGDGGSGFSQLMQVLQAEATQAGTLGNQLLYGGPGAAAAAAAPGQPPPVSGVTTPGGGPVSTVTNPSNPAASATPPAGVTPATSTTPTTPPPADENIYGTPGTGSSGPGRFAGLLRSLLN